MHPLYASSEFPNANQDLHAGRIDPDVWPADVDDVFGDGDVLVVEELPALTATETEIEVVGEERETARESMIRLVSALRSHDDAQETDSEDEDEETFDLAAFSSLTLPTLPPLDPALLASVDEEADVDREPLLTLVKAPEPETMVAEPVVAEPVVAELVMTEPVVGEQTVIAAPVIAEPVVAEVIEPVVSSEQVEQVDAFGQLVETICNVACDAGVSVSAMAMMELLSGRPVPPVLLGAASGTLVVGGVAEESVGNVLVVASKIKGAAVEWARIVRDEGGNLEACGGKTLDEFSADVACAIVGDRSKFDTLRRALRSRGIAAYGLVCNAA